jgi:hypothetical protein
MSMPGFIGEASLYKTGRHYHMIAATAEANGVGLQQLIHFPGIHHCGPCYRDEKGACVRDCIVCPPGPPPDGCDEFTAPCPPWLHCR